MEGYQERLLSEYSELEDRTDKLAAFVVSADFAKVSLQDQSYLEAQLPVQRRLLEILGSRVAAMEAQKKAAPAPKVTPAPAPAAKAPETKDDKKK